ncbi:MAG: LamG domain-containing protein [Planctomycetes bacterium]|nr:LamG domain-containing protein [Planctomycetota bacterium]
MRLRTLRSFSALLALTFGVAAPSALLAQGQGLRFVNGVDAYAEIPYDPSHVPASGITVEAWITYDDASIPAGTAWLWPTIVRQDPSPGRAGYFLRVEAGRTATRILSFWVATANSGNVQVQWPFAAGALSTWTHVAGSYDGATARLFVDGVEVASRLATGRIVDRGGALRIGKGDDSGGPVEVWNGEIDEVRLWPFARSAAQILATRMQELGGVPAGASTWNLNGALVDSSGANHATAQGAIAYQANPLVLASFPVAGASESGLGSASCGGLRVRAGIASVPQRGNSAFALVCTNAPAPGTGVAQFAYNVLPQALPLLGFELWVDPAQLFLSLPVGRSALGLASLPLAVPNSPAVVLATTTVQFLWLDACGPQGLSASSGLALVILP